MTINEITAFINTAIRTGSKDTKATDVKTILLAICAWLGVGSTGTALIEIVDNLLSTAADKVLSAKQGSVIKSMIDAVNSAITSIQSSITGINATLANKVDTSTMNTALAAKVDTNAMNTALANKVDTNAMNTALAVKADKTYVDSLYTTGTAPALPFNASTASTFPNTNNRYIVSVAGSVSGVYLQANDYLIPAVVSPTSSVADWIIIQGNLNKASGAEGIAGLDDIKYTTSAVVKAILDNFAPTKANSASPTITGITTVTHLKYAEQDVNGSGSTASINLDNGSSVFLTNFSSGTGTLTITLSGLQSSCSYLICAPQGATVRPIIMPTSPVTTITGTASTDTEIFFTYRNGKIIITQQKA